MKTSEQLARAAIASGFMIVSRDTAANLQMLQEAIKVINEEGYTDYDVERLRSAGAHLIDCCEDIVLGIPRDGITNYEQQMSEIAENFAELRKNLAEA